MTDTGPFRGRYRVGEPVLVHRITEDSYMRCRVSAVFRSVLRVVTPTDVVIAIRAHVAYRVKPVDAITRLGELIE